MVMLAVLGQLRIAAIRMSRRLSFARRVFLAILLLAALCSPEARAVLIASGDGTENTQGEGFFGWDYVGDVNGLSGTYLGGGWVITANHVGPGDFTLDGTVYPWVPGTEVRLESNLSTLADLVVFAISPYPNLNPLVIRTLPPRVGEFLVLIGCGRDRGAGTTWAPNGPLPPPPDELAGWDWASTHSKRWGTNAVESLTTGLISGTVSFYTSFDEVGVLPEAQATGGDSGGAVFSIDAGGTELAGIIYAAGPTPGQPPNTALFTNLTFAARLDFYRDQIEQITAVQTPVPVVPLSSQLWPILSTALAASGALLARPHSSRAGRR